MNEKSHNALDDHRTDPPGDASDIAGETIARRWLRRANRLARTRLPGRSIRHFARSLARRRGAADRHRPTVWQVEERLRSMHIEPYTAFSPWPPMPGYIQGGRPEPAVPGRALPGTPEHPAAPQHARSPFTHPVGKQQSGPAIPEPARAVNRDAEVIPAPAAAPAEPLPAGVIQSPPLRLDGQVRDRLAGVLEMRIPAVKIYTNQAADQVARQHKADAVTFGDRILFRAGRYEPETPRGLGLLGHELIHASRTRTPSAGPPPVATQAAEQEEALALRNEQRILNQLAVFAAVPAAGNRNAPAAQAPPPNAAAGRAAASDRTVGIAGGPGPPDPILKLSGNQLRQIKDDVYRDLLDRLRTEFEQGA